MSKLGATIDGKPVPDTLLVEYANWLIDRRLSSMVEEQQAQWFAEFLTEKYGKPVTGVHRHDPNKRVTAIPDP